MLFRQSWQLECGFAAWHQKNVMLSSIPKFCIKSRIFSGSICCSCSRSAGAKENAGGKVAVNDLFFWFFNSALQGLRRSAFDSIPQSFHSVVFCGTNGLSSQVCMWSLWCKGPRFTNRDRFGWSAIHSTKFVSVKRIMHFQFWKCCWQEKHQIFSRLCHLPRKMLQR